MAQGQSTSFIAASKDYELAAAIRVCARVLGIFLELRSHSTRQTEKWFKARSLLLPSFTHKQARPPASNFMRLNPKEPCTGGLYSRESHFARGTRGTALA